MLDVNLKSSVSVINLGKAYSINPISFPEYNGSRCEKRQIPALQGNQKTKKEE